MRKGIFQDFDGYAQIVQAIEVSQRQGVDYSLRKDAAQPFIDRLHPSQIRFRVAEVIEETPTAKTLRLNAADGVLPPFQAGQYIALFLEIGGLRTSRPYSISSPPNQIGHYDLTVRRVEGGLVSNHLLDRVGRGDELTGSGPAGHFYHNPIFHDKNMVCLAGGSGITPFMSMIREVVETGLDRNILLLYGNRSLSDAIFHDRLTELAARFGNFKYVPVIENPPAGWDGATGYMTCGLIKQVAGDLSGKTFYLCGPQAMYDFCLAELAESGVPGRKIRREVYGPPLRIDLAPGWPQDVSPAAVFQVRVAGGAPFTAVAGEPLLKSLEKAGVVPPSQCRSGECSLCRVRLVKGRVFEPAGALVRKSDRRYGYVHSCAAYPLTDLEIAL